MEIIFLGTNGWYDTKAGNTISILVKTSAFYIIFDAGYGLAKLDRYIDIAHLPVVLFLSHYHLDHTAGLHVLNKFHFPGGMTICIPRGTKKVLNTLVDVPFTAPLSSLSYPVRILELPGQEKELLPLAVEARPLIHVTLCLGYRIETEGITLAYVPDTGYCENAVELARGADLLLTECAYAGDLTCSGWPHLNPLTAARIAKEGGAKKLFLVHFDALQYPHYYHRREAQKLARSVFPPTWAARDGLKITLKAR